MPAGSLPNNIFFLKLEAGDMNTEVEVNPYELLEVKLESTEQEIRTAYRQRSLKVHPDRVRNVILPPNSYL